LRKRNFSVDEIYAVIDDDDDDDVTIISGAL
jgi:hypothetical protein